MSASFPKSMDKLVKQQEFNQPRWNSYNNCFVNVVCEPTPCCSERGRQDSPWYWILFYTQPQYLYLDIMVSKVLMAPLLGRNAYGPDFQYQYKSHGIKFSFNETTNSLDFGGWMEENFLKFGRGIWQPLGSRWKCHRWQNVWPNGKTVLVSDNTGEIDCTFYLFTFHSGYVHF